MVERFESARGLVLARLRDGVTPAAAGVLASRAIREIVIASVGADAPSVSLESVVPGPSARQSPQARVALWLSGVSMVVLLIATANVGTLLLLRAARRRRDVAIRMTLGAGRRQLARQFVVESLVLAIAGCLMGLVLSRWLADIVRVTLLPNVAPSDRVVDPNVLAVSIVAACLAGLLASLGPLAQLGRRNLSVELRAGGGHGASGRFVFQHALLALQVALSMVLVVGAGLFVQSLRRVQSQDLGFSTSRLLHVELDFRGPMPALERDRVHSEATRRIASVPGVTAVTAVQGMPFSSHNIPPMSVPGYAMPSPGVQQLPIMYAATPAYLEMMGVRLIGGRLFTARDTAGTPLVVLVNETMARTMWPGQSAIGKCVKAGHAGSPELGDPMAAAAFLPCREVVGVVRDSRARSLRTEGDEAKLMQYYVPIRPDAACTIPRRAEHPWDSRAHGGGSGSDGRAGAADHSEYERAAGLRACSSVPDAHRPAAALVAARRDALLRVRRARARHRDRGAVRGRLVSRVAAYAGDRRAAGVRRVGGPRGGRRGTGCRADGERRRRGRPGDCARGRVGGSVHAVRDVRARARGDGHRRIRAARGDGGGGCGSRVEGRPCEPNDGSSRRHLIGRSRSSLLADAHVVACPSPPNDSV